MAVAAAGGPGPALQEAVGGGRVGDRGAARPGLGRRRARGARGGGRPRAHRGGAAPDPAAQGQDHHGRHPSGDPPDTRARPGHPRSRDRIHRSRARHGDGAGDRSVRDRHPVEAEVATRPTSLRPAELVAVLGPRLHEGRVRRIRQWIERDGERLRAARRRSRGSPSRRARHERRNRCPTRRCGTPAVPETPREPATPAPASNGGEFSAPSPRTPPPTDDRARPTGRPAPKGATRPPAPPGRTARPGKRRRGSRGGKNRKRPAGTAGGTEARTDTSGAANAPTPVRPPRPTASVPRHRPAARACTAHAGDRRDERAGADRGLTTEDVAAEARNEAGLDEPGAADVGEAPDRRHAPGAVRRDRRRRGNGGGRPDCGSGATGDGTPRKRRRRGGRGRSRSGGDGSAAAAGAAVVTSTIHDDDGFDLEELDEETLERRRGKTRKGRPTGRYQMVVHVDDRRHDPDGACSRAASLVEHYVSRPEDDATSIDGNIYLGKVQNVLPGMEAAFIDIGTPKNGVIYRGRRAVRRVRGRGSGGGRRRSRRLLKNGQSILVQVTKNPIGAKGARLTQDVSLAGRFVVMVPNQPDDLRHLEATARRRAQATAQGARGDPARERRADRADRGRGRDRRRARARPRPAAGPVEADLGARSRRGKPAQAALPGAAARRARHPRGVHQGVPLDRHRRPGACTRT